MVLFISNGHGEDLIASTILDPFLERVQKSEVKALPLVGTGKAYQRHSIEIFKEGYDLPSGGFARQSREALLEDLKKGLLSLTKRQISYLRSMRERVRLGVVVGDIYPLLLSSLFLKRPLLFLPTAKSEYIYGHLSIEVRMMRKMASYVFPRDEKTASSLRERGVRATFLGNVMMDAFTINNHSFLLSKREEVLGILPGSREEAFLNLHTILPVLKILQERGVELVPVMALAPSLSLEELERRLPTHWKLSSKRGEGVCGVIEREGVELFITTTGFGDLLERATLFLGLAGTANEQAVGMGKVVVAFVGEGPQFNPSFVKAQRRLLGEALSVVEREPSIIAEEIERLFLEERERRERGKVGRERMGPPGGATKISQAIYDVLKGL